MSATARAIVDDVLGRQMTREIWSGNYDKVLPLSVQPFDLSAVLPAVFFMFRFGHRRGRGKFVETFGAESGTPKERRRAATVERVASLLGTEPTFEGFDGLDDETEQAILGDLLLCFCLENAKHALGRKEQVQRVTPAHYMSSWVDLPESVTHLRYVPEMIVAMLADQKSDYVEQNGEDDKSWFGVGREFDQNLLLQVFHQGIVREGPFDANRTADHFDETAMVGLDQLLMIRLAQQLGEAPDRLRGKSEGGGRISNQRPIAKVAARHFSEDIRRFVRSYADVIPRHSFVDLLESCMSIGLTTIVTSVIELLFEWSRTGEIRKSSEQQPAHLFVDCSNGVQRELHSVAEQSMDDFMRRIQRFPVVLMVLRLLDYSARYDRKLKRLEIPTRPYATEWVNLLGDLLFGRHDRADALMDSLDGKAEQLAEQFAAEYPEAAEMVTDSRAVKNPVWRIAEALTSLQRHLFLNDLVDSVLMTSRPNGLAAKRTVTRKSTGGRSKRRDVRSIVFTDSVLDYLVHLHVLPSGKKTIPRPLAFGHFVDALRERYGFCIDAAPPGMTISNDLLQRNRSVLERRLRDLGLLVGVNDAESMKYLRPRFESPRSVPNEMA